MPTLEDNITLWIRVPSYMPYLTSKLHTRVYKSVVICVCFMRLPFVNRIPDLQWKYFKIQLSLIFIEAVGLPKS